jgi:hypothetical protein
MSCLSVPASAFVVFFSGSGAWLMPHYALPLAMMGLGLLVAAAALGIRVGLYDQGHLAFHRGARLALIGGLTVGAALALLGLLAALTALL